MQPPRYPEAIRDPIHGYVRLTEFELAGIDAREVQRLRSIAQLGMTDRVYPGARHSRFEHALGTLEVATRIFEDLRGRLGIDGLLPRLGLPPRAVDYERLLALTRWVALLHDVGHPPFSHVTEGLLPGGRSHEQLTVDLVRGGQVGGVLRRSDPTLLDDVVRVLEAMSFTSEDAASGGECLPPPLAFAREVIAGEVGADRMDYLLRDSAATGVSYGIFDLDRILHTLVPVEAGRGGLRLGVERGGVLAVEGMLWGRISMFQQVYFHRTRRIFDHHLVQFLRTNLPGGVYPADGAGFTEWSDWRVWELLRRAESDAAQAGHEDAVRILARRHHRALPQELEGRDEGSVREWLAAWSARVVAEVPDADPIADLVTAPRAVTGELRVVGPGGNVEPLLDRSSWIVRFEPRSIGRLYVRRDLDPALVPNYP
ncbi:MAG: HD domain-containing protein [Planctomycetota bacterium]